MKFKYYSYITDADFGFFRCSEDSENMEFIFIRDGGVVQQTPKWIKSWDKRMFFDSIYMQYDTTTDHMRERVKIEEVAEDDVFTELI